jgi:hypothetical protein
VELVSQPDGLGGQLGSRELRPRGGRVARVEDEVEHVDNNAEPPRVLGPLRQLEGGSGCL